MNLQNRNKIVKKTANNISIGIKYKELKNKKQ